MYYGKRRTFYICVHHQYAHKKENLNRPLVTGAACDSLVTWPCNAYIVKYFISFLWHTWIACAHSGNLAPSSAQNGHKGSSYQGCESPNIASPARRSEVSPIQSHVSIKKKQSIYPSHIYQTVFNGFYWIIAKESFFTARAHPSFFNVELFINYPLNILVYREQKLLLHTRVHCILKKEKCNAEKGWFSTICGGYECARYFEWKKPTHSSIR